MRVFNATPLIYLAKAGRASLLDELSGESMVPASVYREVVEAGKRRGEPDAGRIEALVEGGVLAVVEAPSTALAKRLAEHEALHKAERDVLVLADAREGVAVLDETQGRRIAEVEGIRHRGTIGVLFALHAEGVLAPGEVRDAVDAIVEAGWYCSTALYARIVRAIEAL